MLYPYQEVESSSRTSPDEHHPFSSLKPCALVLKSHHVDSAGGASPDVNTYCATSGLILARSHFTAAVARTSLGGTYYWRLASHQTLSSKNNSDLLSRHLKLKSDASGHGEALPLENNATPLAHVNSPSGAVPPIFPANAVGQIDEDINALLPPATSHSFLEDNLEDLNVLWGSVDTNFPLEGLGFGLPNDLISLPGFDASPSTIVDKTPRQPVPDSPPSDDDVASLSNFQLPSLPRNDESSSQDVESASQHCDSRPNSSSEHYPWRISNEDYRCIVTQIDHMRPHLPVSFTLPSKYVLCRYIEGFFTGSHGHLPFLHISTVSIADLSPPLILAIMAMGAQYRFERERAVRFYKASRSLIDHHISLYTQSHSLYTPRSHVETTEKTHFEVLQAQIILTTLGTWGNHGLLHDSLGIAGQMSLYLRDSGLLLHDRHFSDGSWSAWIQQEGQRRTIFSAYMICSNQTILYNMPPKILNSEVSSLYLPWPEELWRASSASEWKSLRSRWPHYVSFGDGYGQLFHNKPIHQSLSSFGNLVLIHGLFQHIYLAWEASFRIPVSSEDQPTSLPVEFLTRFHSALRRWQKSWETSSDPSITPSSPKGPLGFNATAIFRIACIRLHLNLGPHRSLGTGEPEAIASAFCNAPRPAQTPQIYHAVLQSIHALSIPVRLGVEYVARTQTLTWSTIHSLCNLECALFLCKWLEMLASDPTKDIIHRDTRRLLRIITSVLREADLAPPGDRADKFEPEQLRRMGAMLVRLLSEILKGAHVFEKMHVFCDSLRTYATLLENDLDSDMAE
ncbi:hypothetical protein UA08_05541 [Talaromyces atroroseus]|uniref:Xylanolytic transcriptional activator regulatory domain-containing protein n=1 Tax=Talaromyces atroroseus TaxID=1441469 RepID=A0A225AX39_TALAT|nr:hypothetical protein UA08_05541 [Talaromyces atroroseus]OKL59015.1 hypothetical protein UA08_05541 [Talaromyces atroroseus]